MIFLSNHVLFVLHVYSFTTSTHAVISCIKETKLNLSDTQYVKTTSLLRRPVVNSHLHKHQRPLESHLSISAATYLTPFSTYGCIISVLSSDGSWDLRSTSPPLHSSSNWDDARYGEAADPNWRARLSPPRSQDGGGGRASLRSHWAVFVRGNSCG